jgi:hypothetical protein
MRMMSTKINLDEYLLRNDFLLCPLENCRAILGIENNVMPRTGRSNAQILTVKTAIAQ